MIEENRTVEAGNVNREAFDQLAELHRCSLKKFCGRFFVAADDCDDAVQEILHRAWVHWSDYRGDSPVKNWLFAIANNYCLNRLRQKRITISLNDPSVSMMAERQSADNTSDDAILVIMRQKFIDCVYERAKIAKPTWIQLDYAIFFLYIGEEYNFSDIAKTLDQNPNTVRSRFNRNIRPVIAAAAIFVFETN